MDWIFGQSASVRINQENKKLDFSDSSYFKGSQIKFSLPTASSLVISGPQFRGSLLHESRETEIEKSRRGRELGKERIQRVKVLDIERGRNREREESGER